MSLITNFISELKARKVRKTMAIYLSSALTTVGVVKLFQEVYGVWLWDKLFPIVFTILTCGGVSAFVYAWFHGMEGAQKFQKKEFLFHSIVLIAAVVISVRVGSAPSLKKIGNIGKSIAVLPFENSSEKKEDEFFSDGIMEDILTNLSKIGDLKVIAKSSVMKYKEVKKTSHEIGAELGVAAVLEGSVRRYGDRVRITGRLINTQSEEYIWSKSYDREMKDVFDIQSEVAQRIATELKAQLSPDEVKRVSAKPTTNLEAYALYLRGRDHKNKRTADDNDIAITLQKKTIELDPEYALAYAELGMAYIARYTGFGYASAWADSGIAMGRKAIELDPVRAEGYHAVGKGYESKGKFSLALEYYNKALELSPNYAPSVTSIGWVAYGVGKLDEALEWTRKGADLTPDVAARYTSVGVMYNYLDEDSLALKWYRKALALETDFLTTNWYLIYFYLYDRKLNDARRYLDIGLQKFPNDVSFLSAAGDVELLEGHIQLAHNYYEKSVKNSSLIDGPGNQLAFTKLKLGQTREANAILDSNLAEYKRLSVDSPEDFNNPVAVATNYAIRNKQEEALSWFRIAVERGCREYRWLSIEPLIENMRNNSGFQDILKDIRARVKASHLRAKQRGLLD